MDDSFSGDNLDEDGSDSVTRCDDHDSMVKIRTDVSKLRVNDEINTNDTKDEQVEEEVDDLSEDELLAQMGYAKPEPKRGFEDEGENDQTSGSLQQLTTISLPPVSNLVSALKGSRSKEGKSPVKLRVSWAPDVYDPTPASPDQFALSNSHYEQKPLIGRNKRGGKGVQEIEEGSYVRGNRLNKGNGVRSAKVSRKERDKKQVKRHGRDKKYSSYSNYEDD